MLAKVQELRDREGLSVAEAQAQAGVEIPHTTFYRWSSQLRESGWRGLVDKRRWPIAKMTERIGGFVEGMGRTDPELSSDQIRKRVLEGCGVDLSVRTIQAKLQIAGLSRLPSRFRKKDGKSVNSAPTSEATQQEEPGVKEELEGAGLAWLAAASEITGYGREMAEVVKAVAQALEPPPVPLEVDRTNRDDKGRFLPEYNAARPRRDPKVGAVFESVEAKRANKDLRRLSIVTTSVETIEKKLMALIALPVVSEKGRFNGVTDPRGEWLRSLGGHDYRTETLSKFARELKFAGASTSLIGRHAQIWYRELSSSLGEDASALIFYVDGTTKQYWTEFFSRSGKVTMVGRVMPCLESILIHTGAGVPLYLKTFAGAASLVSNLLPALHEMEAAIGEGMLGRLTVVDGGMNAVALFKQFDLDNHRRFITPLGHNQVKDLSQVQDLAPLAPYRNGDWIGEGWMNLRDTKDDKAPPYRIRVVILKRRTKETFSAYGTNTLPEEFSDKQLMDAYFQRWPAQELVFRELNGGASFKAIHGYGKCQVLNISVIDEITKLSSQIENATVRLQKRRDSQEESARTLQELKTEEDRLRQERARGKQSEAGQKGKNRATFPKHNPETKRLVQAELENRTLKLKLAQAEHKQRSSEVRQAEEQIKRKTSERAVLETRREIYQTDVELDQILSVLKLGCALLVQVLLHQFFGGLAIGFNTFITQIFALPGTRIVTDTTETIRFRANRRNPKLMKELEQACQRFNAINHQRKGRTVRFEVAWPPGSGHAT